jgi:hypothetical protein
MNWMVRTSTLQDAISLAPRMTAADAAEVWAMAHWTPYGALEESIRMSAIVYTWLINGEVACMYGCGSENMIGGIGRPWLLTSPLLKRNAVTFMRCYRDYLDDMLRYYPVLETFVDARHVVCLRWLKRIKFTVGDALPFGIDKLPFHRVTLEA